MSNRAFLLTMSLLKPMTDLADEGYWKRVAKTIHTVSVLLVYTAPNQKLVSLHNGLKALKSEELWAECDREIAKGRDFGLSIFCEAPPTGLCRDFLPVLPEHDMVVFCATVKGDSLKVSNKAYSKTKALFARKLLAVKDTNRGNDSRMTLLPPWMTPLASPVISPFRRPTPQFWMQDDLLTATPDGMLEPVKSMVDMNDAEFRTNTLLAFTGGPYKPATPAGSGTSTSSSSKGANAAKAPPKDDAKRVSPRSGSPEAVTSSTGDAVPSETKKTATPALATINEESKDGNDGNKKVLSSESSDSGSDDDASRSNDETGKGQSRSGTSSSSSSDSDSSSSNTPVETDEMNALLHNTETDTEAGEKSDAGASKPPERPLLKLVLMNQAKPSTSGAKGMTVKYGNLEVLPGDGIVMVDCTPGTA